MAHTNIVSRIIRIPSSLYFKLKEVYNIYIYKLVACFIATLSNLKYELFPISIYMNGLSKMIKWGFFKLLLKNRIFNMNYKVSTDIVKMN